MKRDIHVHDISLLVLLSDGQRATKQFHVLHHDIDRLWLKLLRAVSSALRADTCIHDRSDAHLDKRKMTDELLVA
jgi:hypothetical protein